jgi:hypothetical protein
MKKKGYLHSVLRTFTRIYPLSDREFFPVRQEKERLSSLQLIIRIRIYLQIKSCKIISNLIGIGKRNYRDEFLFDRRTE